MSLRQKIQNLVSKHKFHQIKIVDGHKSSALVYVTKAIAKQGKHDSNNAKLLYPLVDLIIAWDLTRYCCFFF